MHEAITVTGGVGGTRAHLEDLERCAAVLNQVVADLAALGGTLTRLRHVVEDAALVSPSTAGPARDAVDGLVSYVDGVPAARDRAHAAAADLRRTARTYADADAAVGALMHRWAVTVAHTLGEGGPLVWLGVGAAAGGVAAVGSALVARKVVALRMLARTPTVHGLALRGWAGASAQRGGTLGRLIGGPGLLPAPPRPTTAVLDPLVGVGGAFLAGAAPGRRPVPGGLVPWGRAEHGLPAGPVREAARTLLVPSVLAARALHGPTTLVVTPQPDGRRDRRQAPRTTADLVAGVADVYPGASTPPGTVAVHRLEQPDGRASWVVTVPGTQSASLTGGPLPADMASNLALVAGGSDDVSALVREAMHGAGIPPDEPVQIVGHSQGGLAAVAVANHPEVVAGYDVRTVVTAGSPVAGMPLPDGVLGLHLEHAQDGVPAADGLRPPDRVNQTFVEVDLGRSDDPDQRAAALSWTGAHEVDTYARTAAGLGGVPDDSLAHATRTIEDLLGAPGTTVRTQLFTGVRMPLPGAPGPG